MGLTLECDANVESAIMLTRELENTPVLIFTTGAAHLPAALLAGPGIRGIIGKKATLTDIVRSIDRLCKGQPYTEGCFLYADR